MPQIIAVLGLHFVGDFIAQSDWMAQNKSKKFWPLWIHVSVYSLFLLPFGLKYAGMNLLLHMVTDAVSSRVTSKLWAAGQRHWFFVVIGLDQLVHQVCLILTLQLR